MLPRSSRAPLEPRIAVVTGWNRRRSKAPPLSLEVGATLGDLRITGHLARGRTTELYQVWSASHASLLAAKVIAPDQLGNPDAIAAFRREERTIRAQRHPNLVRWFGGGVAAGRPYLLQEFVPGPSLRELLDATAARRLRASEALRIALLVGGALHGLHRRGYLYLDLKPANVLFRDSQPLLIDFDASRRYAAGRRAASRDGTAPYMAPEQILRQPLSPATDVYGMGALLYEMLTGRWPHEDPRADEWDEWNEEESEASLPPTPQSGPAPRSRATAASLRARFPQLTQAPVPPRRHGVRIRPELEAVLLRALSHRPEERWPAIYPMLATLAPMLSSGQRLWPVASAPL